MLGLFTHAPLRARSGYEDIVLASNADDTVAVYRNIAGTGDFEQRIVYQNADFVLSCALLNHYAPLRALTTTVARSAGPPMCRVAAGDFDHDGDMDLASASYFDGTIRWYENIDGSATSWVVCACPSITRACSARCSCDSVRWLVRPLALPGQLALPAQLMLVAFMWLAGVLLCDQAACLLDCLAGPHFACQPDWPGSLCLRSGYGQ